MLEVILDDPPIAPEALAILRILSFEPRENCGEIGRRCLDHIHESNLPRTTGTPAPLKARAAGEGSGWRHHQTLDLRLNIRKRLLREYYLVAPEKASPLSWPPIRLGRGECGRTLRRDFFMACPQI